MTTYAPVNNTTLHVVVDIETLATSYDAVITAAAIAVIHPNKCITVWSSCISSQGQSTRAIDPKTVEFWNALRLKSPELVAIMDGPTVHLASLFMRLNYWARVEGALLWSNGITFDIPILKDVATTIGTHSLKFHYRDILDLRTLRRTFRSADIPAPPNWLAHSPAHDALLDAVRLSRYLDPALGGAFQGVIATPAWQKAFTEYASYRMISGMNIGSTIRIHSDGRIVRVDPSLQQVFYPGNQS